jgi:hypothetical protein
MLDQIIGIDKTLLRLRRSGTLITESEKKELSHKLEMLANAIATAPISLPPQVLQQESMHSVQIDLSNPQANTSTQTNEATQEQD